MDALIVSDISHTVTVKCLSEIGYFSVRIERTDKGPNKPVAEWTYRDAWFHKGVFWMSLPEMAEHLNLQDRASRAVVLEQYVSQHAFLSALDLSTHIRAQVDSWFLMRVVVACRSLTEY